MERTLSADCSATAMYGITDPGTRGTHYTARLLVAGDQILHRFWLVFPPEHLVRQAAQLNAVLVLASCSSALRAVNSS